MLPTMQHRTDKLQEHIPLRVAACMQAVLTAAQGGHSVGVKALRTITMQNVSLLFSADLSGTIKVMLYSQARLQGTHWSCLLVCTKTIKQESLSCSCF